MKRYVLTLVAALALGLSMLGSVSAASDKHTDPGTPGEANCEGQTAAYAAQLAKNLGLDIQPGIGNLAKALNLSVQRVQAQIDAMCATP